MPGRRFMCGMSSSGRSYTLTFVIMLLISMLVFTFYSRMEDIARYLMFSNTDCPYGPDPAAAAWRDAPTLLQRSQLYWNHTVCSQGVCDTRLQPDTERMLRSPYNISLTAEDFSHYTLVILTHDRVKYLIKSLKHYGQMEHVTKILVHWNNPNEAWPDVRQLGAKIPIVFSRFPPGNKLRLRLHPHPQITTSAVFVIDDDLIVSETDMKKAFITWKAFPWTIVGFTPRGFAKDDKFPYHYGVGEPSMVLTGAAFIHREYMRMYADTLPPQIADMIDEFVNCEDISMNMMMAHHCRCAHAIYVKPSKAISHLSESDGGGLWTLNNHTRERSMCIESFQRFYHPMPLVESQCVR